MKKWSDEEIESLMPPYGDARIRSAQCHIWEMQDAVEKMRDWYPTNYGIQQTINTYFWPEEEKKMPDDHMGIAIDDCMKELATLREEIVELVTKIKNLQDEKDKKIERKRLLKEFLAMARKLLGDDYFAEYDDDEVTG